MVKLLQNNWKLIVITLLCAHWYVDAELPFELQGITSKAFLRNIVRRLMYNDVMKGGTRRNMAGGSVPDIGLHLPQQRNLSQLREEEIRRSRMKKHTTTESPSTKELQPSKSVKEVGKMKRPTRFLIQKDPGSSKHHSHKEHYHEKNKTANITASKHHRGDINNTIDMVMQRVKLPDVTEPTPQQVKPSSTTVKNYTYQEPLNIDSSKPAIRAGRYREESNESTETTTKRYKKTTTIRITKMEAAYQLQEDPDEVTEAPKETPKSKNKKCDRLNPYAIDNQMKRFMERCRNKMNITMEVIGRTAEYNKIVLLKITDIKPNDAKFYRVLEHKYAEEPPEKKIIFIVHGLTVMGMGTLIDNEAMFNTLMSFYAAHLPYFDIFVIPIANPDGYTANLNTHNGKFWNKNMSPQTSCSGVALDRNFDVEWNSSHKISPCSHLYPGSAPFSEPETRAVRDVLHLYNQKIVAYIHVHASTFGSSIFKGDAVLYPKGYTNIQTDDDKYLDIKGDVEDSIKNATFRVISVTVEPLYYWYGKVVGTSVDYAATVYGIPYSMEFSMQAYAYMEGDALNQIWKRIIDVVFKSIWKSVSGTNDVKK